MNTAGGSSGDPVAAVRLQEADLARYNADGFLRIPGLIDGDVAVAMYAEVMSVVTAAGGHDGSKLK